MFKRVVAYLSKEKEFGGVETFTGTPGQIVEAIIALGRTWSGMGTEGVDVIYIGKDMKEAKKLIKDTVVK